MIEIEKIKPQWLKDLIIALTTEFQQEVEDGVCAIQSAIENGPPENGWVTKKFMGIAYVNIRLKFKIDKKEK